MYVVRSGALLGEEVLPSADDNDPRGLVMGLVLPSYAQMPLQHNHPAKSIEMLSTVMGHYHAMRAAGSGLFKSDGACGKFCPICAMILWRHSAGDGSDRAKCVCDFLTHYYSTFLLETVNLHYVTRLPEAGSALD